MVGKNSPEKTREVGTGVGDDGHGRLGGDDDDGYTGSPAMQKLSEDWIHAASELGGVRSDRDILSWRRR